MPALVALFPGPISSFSMFYTLKSGHMLKRSGSLGTRLYSSTPTTFIERSNMNKQYRGRGGRKEEGRSIHVCV